MKRRTSILLILVVIVLVLAAIWYYYSQKENFEISEQEKEDCTNEEKLQNLLDKLNDANNAKNITLIAKSYFNLYIILSILE